MNRVTSKLLLSIFAILMAIISASTVTLAWFTLSNNAKVSSFELNIIEDDGLEIRIVQDDLHYDSGWRVNTSTKMSGSMVPITTLDGKNFRNLDFSSASKSYYLTFTAHFRTHVNSSIALSRMDASSSNNTFLPESEITVLENGQYVTYGPKTENKSLSSVSVADGFRASFITGTGNLIYLFNRDKGQGNYYGFQKDGQWVNPAIDYYNKQYHTNISTPFAYVDSSNNIVNETEINSFSTRDTFYLYHKETPSTKLRVINTIDQSQEMNMNSNGVIIPVMSYDAQTKYYTGSVEINIWLEGWDADCFDAIVDTTLSMNLGFIKIERK
jgi:hypothetical protein